MFTVRALLDKGQRFNSLVISLQYVETTATQIAVVPEKVVSLTAYEGSHTVMTPLTTSHRILRTTPASIPADYHSTFFRCHTCRMLHSLTTVYPKQLHDLRVILNPQPSFPHGTVIGPKYFFPPSLLFHLFSPTQEIQSNKCMNTKHTKCFRKAENTFPEKKCLCRCLTHNTKHSIHRMLLKLPTVPDKSFSVKNDKNPEYLEKLVEFVIFVFTLAKKSH